MIQRMLAIWPLVPLPFLNPTCTSRSSRFTYCWSLAWRILSTTLLACEMSAIVQFKYFLALTFFGIKMKTDLFQPCGHCWVFQMCWHIECSTLTPSSFRILNNSDGILLPPPALFGVQSIPGPFSFVPCQILIGSWKISPPATFPTIRHKVKFLCFWHGSFMYTGNYTIIHLIC